MLRCIATFSSFDFPLGFPTRKRYFHGCDATKSAFILNRDRSHAFLAACLCAKFHAADITTTKSDDFLASFRWQNAGELAKPFASRHGGGTPESRSFRGGERGGQEGGPPGGVGGLFVFSFAICSFAMIRAGVGIDVAMRGRFVGATVTFEFVGVVVESNVQGSLGERRERDK